MLMAVTGGASTAFADSQVRATPGTGITAGELKSVASLPQFGLLSGAGRLKSRFGYGNQCLDADFDGGGNGTKVQAWTCNGSDQQKWYLYDDWTWENAHFRGMCLDADFDGHGANGTKVQLWSCNGSDQQKWGGRENDLAIYNVRFLNNYRTVLDRDPTTANGAQVQLWAKNFQPQQWWDLLGP
ncbi:RICIN domain-containing protein [Streptomyces sp. NPDC059994]|uniref:RICIN domain-containing protein n=1 Tax=Streptomyces sp. NPDC059994 TaxID=3347029 RepID=UPI0036947A59